MNKQYNKLWERVNYLESLILDYVNGGPGSGNFGHAGRPGERGGSASASGSVRALGKGIVDRVRETGGFTVNAKGEFIDVGKSSGFGIGGVSNESSISVEDWNNSTKRKKFIDKYLEQNYDKLLPNSEGQYDNYLGGWVDDGKVFLDISNVVKNEKEATIRAMKTDQDAIFDYKSGESLRTEDLVKKYKLEKEYQKYKGIRAKERAKA